MTKAIGPLAAETTTWLSVVSQLFAARMNRLLEPFGLTQGQFSILHHIVHQSGNGALRIADIADAVEVNQPAVTKAVAKFQDVGLVQTTASTTDKRSKTITPTDAAGPFLDSIYDAIGPDLFQMFEGASQSEVETFATQLRKLALWLDGSRSKT